MGSFQTKTYKTYVEKVKAERGELKHLTGTDYVYSHKNVVIVHTYYDNIHEKTSKHQTYIRGL